MSYSRREFLTQVSAVGVSSLTLLLVPGLAKAGPSHARYRRHNVMSAAGQKMLKSYAVGIKAMLELPAEHPHNWFRNAFVHFLDCPHGNWWFYVWHRGYIGYLEQVIRKYSKNSQFALPFWDWTMQPELPAQMFDGVLSPTAAAFAPYTSNLEKFTHFIQPTMKKYWDGLSAEQRKQQDMRGYTSFDLVWNDVTGYSPATDAGVSGNMAFAITCGARYPTRNNPKLNGTTKKAVSPETVTAGLEPKQYYDQNISSSFTSSKTESHLMQPNDKTQFSILEGSPHNKVHNYIGGVGAIDPGPYGNMTNFLSPVDPIFFLHHANMDRLWDVWTHQQLKAQLPIAPVGDDLAPFMNEPFLFFVDLEGKTVSKKAEDFFSTQSFNYDYGPGFGERLAIQPRHAQASEAVSARISNNSAQLDLPKPLLKSHMDKSLPGTLLAEITVERPAGVGAAREYDVLLNAPDSVQRSDSNSPYYIGTIAFFGPAMSHHAGMSHVVTFVLPLDRTAPALKNLNIAEGSVAKLNLRLVTSGGNQTKAPVVREVSIRVGG